MNGSKGGQYGGSIHNNSNNPRGKIQGNNKLNTKMIMMKFFKMLRSKMKNYIRSPTLYPLRRINTTRNNSSGCPTSGISMAEQPGTFI